MSPMCSARQKAPLLPPLLLASLLLLLPGTTWALSPSQDEDTPPEGLEVTTVAEATTGPIQGEWFATLTARLGVRLGLPALRCESGQQGCDTTLEGVFEAPLRLHLQGEQAGQLRAQDWDEGADAARIIRRIHYGQREEPVWVRLAELSAISLNGGTIVWNHFNTVGPNLRRLGASAQVRLHLAEVALLVDDVLSPQLVATSLGLRPARWFEATESGPLSRVRISGEVAWDLEAPADPDVPGQTVRTVLGGGRLSVDLPAWEDLWRWQAWASWNGHDGIGDGVHLGAEIRATPSERWLSLSLQGEWIRSQGGYIPRYFGPLYALERTALQGFGSQGEAGKLWTASRLGTPGRQVFGTLGLHLPEVRTKLTVALGHEWRRPQADTFLGALHVGPVGRLGASLFLARSGLERGWEPWRGRADTLAGAEGRFWILGDTLYATGRWGKQWDLEAEAPLELWEVGVGVQWALGLR